MTAPNIIFFLCDDLTFKQLRFIPQVFKRIAKNGVNFLNAHCATPLCQPARATLLSGQFSHNNGIVGNLTDYTTLDVSTCLPNKLKNAGYTTCHVGKYMNAYLVTDNGGTPPTGWNEWHAITPQQYFNYNINDNGVVTAKGSADADYYTSVCTDRANSFINSVVGKFYLYIAYKAPHFDPTGPNGGYFSAFAPAAYDGVVPSSVTFPQDPNFNAEITNAPTYMQVSALDSTAQSNINSFWRAQKQTLFAVSNSIMQILDALATAGKDTNTVVIFSCDHGYMHGEHRDPAQKFVPYLPCSHIPLVISGPASLVAQNKVCNRIVSQVDIPATIFDLTGVAHDASRPLDGVSLAPLLSDPLSSALHSGVLVEWRTKEVPGGGAPECEKYFMWATDNYAYVEYDEVGESELYDLKLDPWQLTNQTSNSAYAATKASLAASLATMKTCAGSACVI